MWLLAAGVVNLRVHPGNPGLLAPFILIAFVVCVGAVVVPLLGLGITATRGVKRTWRFRRRRPSDAEIERHARAMMSELCPHGWRAQITLFAPGDEERGAGPVGAGSQVALDWTELRDESGRPAVMRRVWAPTIGDALEAMVADRRTDETLERIERGAVNDGALWPDV